MSELTISNLELNYKKHHVLANVNLSVHSGQLIGLLGLNGSGKSTLLSAIAGIKKPLSGSLFFDQIPSTSKEYKSHFGFVTQSNALVEELSGMDNLRLWVPLSKKEIMDRLSQPPLSTLGITSFIDKAVKSMSGGMKKRIALAAVLMGEPEVLLMDEPFASLDMLAKEDIHTMILNFVSQGGICIIASHEERIFNLCHQVYYLNDGKMTLLPENQSPLPFLRGANHA